MILIAFDPSIASQFFADCRTAATINNELDLQTQEQGLPILVCAGPLRPWSLLWPDLRHVE